VKSAALRRVLLVGFMGSGKTSVGRELAARLGWRFSDFDEAIERREGASVAEIFARRGEPYFREVERAVAERLLDEERIVLAAGGGWAAAPGRLSALPNGTASFWLRVTPDEALRRVSEQPGTRPLLRGTDPIEAASRLVAERSRWYAEATWTVDTDRSTVEDVSARILGILAREYPEIRTA
jgi:shikimate kinase